MIYNLFKQRQIFKKMIFLAHQSYSSDTLLHFLEGETYIFVTDVIVHHQFNAIFQLLDVHGLHPGFCLVFYLLEYNLSRV